MPADPIRETTAWDGRPPSEHLAAKAHILRMEDGDERVCGWDPDGWWMFMGNLTCLPAAEMAAEGFAYVTGLHPQGDALKPGETCDICGASRPA